MKVIGTDIYIYAADTAELFFVFDEGIENKDFAIFVKNLGEVIGEKDLESNLVSFTFDENFTDVKPQ